MPDFDIDFCQDRRGEVVRYVAEAYGAEQVAGIATYGTLAAKGAIRDVGRVLGMSFGQTDAITKMMPQMVPSLAEAIKADPAGLGAALEATPETQRLRNVALRVEGLVRLVGTHAAGVVIGDRPLGSLVPLYRDPRTPEAMPATQFDMKQAEKAGLVKFDFLGVKTLSVLRMARELVRLAPGRTGGGPEIDLAVLPPDDAPVYRMLTAGDTLGVFQFESPGMRAALGQIAPDRIEDIVAVCALYRPGPMAMIPDYATRNALEPIPEIHPAIGPILRETFGMFVSQEQVMQVAQAYAGYTLAGADLLHSRWSWSRATPTRAPCARRSPATGAPMQRAA